MKNLAYTIIPAFFILMNSCESKSENAEKTVPPTSTGAVSPTIPIQNTTTTNANLPVVNNTSGPALNPEHGKPGHRCDISVGAPLNSPASNKPAPSITTSVPTTNTSQITPTLPITQNAPRINPKHGEPGHRCDIAVGAPLDSKPKQ